VDAQGNHYCLDANAQQTYNYGAVIQYLGSPREFWRL
jgi:hypothetical protein